MIFLRFFGRKIWPLKVQSPYCILSGGKFLPLNHLNNSNFVRPNPGIGSNFLEELRKLRFLWSKRLLRTRLELDSSSTFKTRIGLGLTHPSLPVPKFYDPIYQTLWLWMPFKIDFSAKLYQTLWLFENPLFSNAF